MNTDHDKNIFWQGSEVTLDQRTKRMRQQGMVLWLTGISGSGKSTLAIELEKTIFAHVEIAQNNDKKLQYFLFILLKQ